MLDYVYRYCEQLPKEREPSILDLPPPRHLNFVVDQSILDSIAAASRDLDALVTKLNLAVHSFDDFGKTFIKSQRVSPDSFMQIAMQLAYFRRHQEAPATYESASLRRFRFGRTDTIRSCSVTSDEFVRAMATAGAAGGTATKAELRAMMIDAINAHKSYVKAAINGEGIDRHLLGMKLAAMEQGKPTPPLYEDSTYARAMSFNLSTSQVACKADLCMAFGPALDNGYGICYNPKDDKILFSVSSFDNPDYDVMRFGEALKSSFRDMSELLLFTCKL